MRRFHYALPCIISDRRVDAALSQYMLPSPPFLPLFPHSPFFLSPPHPLLRPHSGSMFFFNSESMMVLGGPFLENAVGVDIGSNAGVVVDGARFIAYASNACP